MNFLPPPSRDCVQQGLAALYAEAEMSPQSLDSPIVPLSAIVAATNLKCVEIAGLTMHTAMLYLAREHILPDIETGKGENDPLAGFLYATEHYGTIFASQEDLLVRRRFTIAHELGHYFMHVQPALPHLHEQGLPEVYEYFPLHGVKSDEDESSDGAHSSEVSGGHLQLVGGSGKLPWSHDMVEREADAFAAELLMPTMIVHLLYQRYRSMVSREDLVWRLASEMLVSRAATRHRLRDLGLLSNAE